MKHAAEWREYLFEHIKDAENLDKSPLQSQCIMWLKEEFLILKYFVIGDINKILEKLKTSTHSNNEHALCQGQIKYLREENNS